MTKPESSSMKNVAGQRREGWLILRLCVLGFLLLFGYAVARPSIESLFLEAYGSQNLPYAWLGVALAAIVTVDLYGRVVGRMTFGALFAWICLSSALILAVLMGARQVGIPGSTYALYLWKDVYIVLLIELFWTMANSRFPLSTARWLYGLFCTVGSAGGISGGFVVGKLAASLGTAQVPWLMVPLLLLTMLVSWLGFSKGAAPQQSRVAVRLGEGLRVCARSRYLGLMIVLIAVIQVVVTLIDYQFNTVVEQSFSNLDSRTRAIGRVYAGIDGVSLFLQLASGGILRVLGVSLTLLGIPLVLGSSVLAFVALPHFLTMAVAKVASKAMDYSIFRVAKELLYLPLGAAEKTQGKAAVDVLGYRVAKGGASLLLLALVHAGSSPWVVSFFALGLIGLWFAITSSIVRRYREQNESQSTRKTPVWVASA